jgi:hypothetical protein
MVPHQRQTLGPSTAEKSSSLTFIYLLPFVEGPLLPGSVSPLRRGGHGSDCSAASAYLSIGFSNPLRR